VYWNAIILWTSFGKFLHIHTDPLIDGTASVKSELQLAIVYTYALISHWHSEQLVHIQDLKHGYGQRFMY